MLENWGLAMTKDEALKKAFKQAFQLGQDYWYQADHEYVSQNKKSDVTRAKFEQLMEDAIKETLAQPEQEPCCYGGIAHDCHAGKGCRIVERMKVTQKPPQRKPLTRQQCLHLDVHPLMTIEQVVRVVEAAHGIKGEA